MSTPRLHDFIGADDGRDVVRIYKSEHQQDWTWSVYAIVPARPGLTNGHEADPKEARRKAEQAWAYAKANGRPIRTAVAEQLHVERWPAPEEQP